MLRRRIMGLYRSMILPKLCDFAMRNRALQPYRERVIARAEGRVLEIGAGSGLNLPLYGPRVSELFALEPDPKLRDMAEIKAKEAIRRVRFLDASAESIPFDDRSMDTVVTTWTLCTIPNASRAVKELRRVLKPDGRLLFVEHGLSPEQRVQSWQNGLPPIWKRIGGGCHLNRPIKSLIESGRFELPMLATGDTPRPPPMTHLDQ